MEGSSKPQAMSEQGYRQSAISYLESHIEATEHDLVQARHFLEWLKDRLATHDDGRELGEVESDAEEFLWRLMVRGLAR